MNDPTPSSHRVPGAVRRTAGVVVFLAIASTAGAAGAGERVVGEEPVSWPIVGMQVATVLWFFAIGASVGSFLNVVVHRVPLGLNLSHPPSRCPACETPILRQDNVPVFGWLWLRGRCRACTASIAPRYPIVEAVVGAMFVLLLFVEVSSGGGNLPGREDTYATGLVATLWFLRWDLLALYGYHVFLLCTLLAAGLIGYDGHSIRRLLPGALLVGVVAPLVWSGLHPVHAVGGNSDRLDGLRWEFAADVGPSVLAVMNVAAGAVGGFIVGSVLAAVATDDLRRRTNVVGMVVLAGVFLGWQAVVVLASVLALPFTVLVGVRRSASVPSPELAIAAGVLVQIVFWRPLAWFFGG